MPFSKVKRQYHLSEASAVLGFIFILYFVFFCFKPTSNWYYVQIFIWLYVVAYCSTLFFNVRLFRHLGLESEGEDVLLNDEEILKKRELLFKLPMKRFKWVLLRFAIATVVVVAWCVFAGHFRFSSLLLLLTITAAGGLSAALITFFQVERILQPLHRHLHTRIEHRDLDMNLGSSLSVPRKVMLSLGAMVLYLLFILLWLGIGLIGKEFNSLSEFFNVTFFLSLFVFGLLVLIQAAILSYSLGQNLTESIATLNESMSRAREGDLGTRTVVLSSDETGALAHHFNTMMKVLSEIFGKVRQVSDSVKLVADRLSVSAVAMSEGVELQATSTDTTASSMAQMQESITEVADSVNVLFNETNKTSNSIIEMASSIEAVADSIESLSMSVDTTSTSIEEMNASIKQVAENSLVLNKSAQKLFKSLDEMIQTINEVETWAIESSKLSNAVTIDADKGHQAVQQTIEGMEKIHRFFQTTGEVIQSLGQRSELIGNILVVIDDVSSQTNLLALNAAIISAQADEHGKEFSVVADEIRDLAEKAAVSTKEISRLIKDVQQEAARAVETMEEGARLVAGGVKLTHRAGVVLKQIIDSSTESAKMTTLIEKTSIQQVSRSREIGKIVDHFKMMSDQIAIATKEQKIGISQIMRESENMRDMTLQVKQATVKQADESRSISKAVSEVKEMVERIRTATSQQKSESLSVLEAVEIFKDITLKNVDSMVEMDKAVDTLAAQVRSLESQVAKFRV